jgi:hypothetical protein
VSGTAPSSSGGPRPKRKTGRLSGPSFDSPDASESCADAAQERLKVSADEDKRGNGDDCDEREDECVFRETLSFLAVKDQEHDASFRKTTGGVRRDVGLALCRSATKF